MSPEVGQLTSDVIGNVLHKKARNTLDALTAHALFEGYARRYADFFCSPDVRIVEVEHEFRNPIYNPDTEAEHPVFEGGGKMDGILEVKGVLKLLEHKTTSEAIDPAANYWDRLKLDNQISKYIINGRLRGIDIQEILYDVIRKPTIKQTKKETEHDYFFRLQEDIAERPEFYYAQRSLARHDSELIEHMRDDWQLAEQISWHRQHKVWPRNPSACTMYGSCEYFDLCTGALDVNGIHYKRVDTKHAELSTVADGDKELLTNSRSSCFRQCPKKHFLKYEEPVKRVGYDSYALYFGDLFHQALEHWLIGIQRINNQSSNVNQTHSINHSPKGKRCQGYIHRTPGPTGGNCNS